jgi:hypothetical protein
VGDAHEEGTIAVPTTETPSSEHNEFDALCAHVEEFEHLPAVKAVPPELVQNGADDEQAAPLDELILAGLVSP